MSDTTQLVRTFYTALQQRDHETMIACYHPQVRFSDPVFTNLRGDEAKAMWHMLCERGQDLQVSFRNVETTQKSGRAHWEAKYTFSTGRPVHNIIDAEFTFADGLIVTHTDTFDLYRWTRQALGPLGMVAGWTPMVQKRVRKTAVSSLNHFISKHPEYQTI